MAGYTALRKRVNNWLARKISFEDAMRIYADQTRLFFSTLENQYGRAMLERWQETCRMHDELLTEIRKLNGK